MEEEKKVRIFEDRLLNSLPHNSIDCVILGYDDEQLKVLLLKWKYEDIWSLPGGFIMNSESFDDAAIRILKERTGLGSIFLKQFKTFSSIDRTPTSSSYEFLAMRRILEKIDPNKKEFNFEWFTERFVTTGYFALVDVRKTNPSPDFLSEQCDWVSLDIVPQLLMDHNHILNTALRQLRIELNYLPIGMSLLPKKFTMQQLQKLYESVLEKKLIRSNFQRKMLKLDILIRHEKLMTGASNKAPYLYSFDKNKYHKAVIKGTDFL